MPKKQHNLWLRAWLPTLIWLAVIACESTPMASAHNTGRLLGAVLRLFYPHLTWLQLYNANFVLRKSGHFIGYGILSVVAYRTWWTTWLLSWRRTLLRLPGWRMTMRLWLGRAAALALLTAAAVAGLDEWHQTMLPGRTGTIKDVALDSAAALCAQLLILAISSRQLAVRSRDQNTPSAETAFNQT